MQPAPPHPTRLAHIAGQPLRHDQKGPVAGASMSLRSRARLQRILQVKPKESVFVTTDSRAHKEVYIYI